MFTAMLETAEMKRVIGGITKAIGKRYKGDKTILRLLENDRGNMSVDVQIQSNEMYDGAPRFITYESTKSVVHGEIQVHLHDFAALVNVITQKGFSLTESDSSLEIQTANGTKAIDIATAETFQAIPELWKRGGDIETKPFIKTLKRVNAFSANEMISKLDVIHIEPIKSNGVIESIAFIGADGFRLIKKDVYMAIDKTFNVDKLDIQRVTRLESLFGDWLTVSPHNITNEDSYGYIYFSGNGINYICPNRRSIFPDWRRAFPSKSTATLDVSDVKDFVSRLKAAKEFSSTDSAIIKANGKIELTAGVIGDPDYSSNLDDIASSNGDGIFAFNPELLITLINTNEQNIEMKLPEKGAPAKLTNPQAKEICLLMPLGIL